MKELYRFNVYDMQWRFVENRWYATDCGMKNVGDYFTDNETYTEPVYMKRMS